MSSDSLSWRKRAEAVWPQLFALAVFALALWAQSDAMVGVFYDDGLYVVLAKALAQGEGYRYIHLPDAPAAVHYPFLYPVALSLLWQLWPHFPDNVVLFQIFDSAALGAAAWAMALHARRWNAAPMAAYVALPLGFAAFPLLTIVGVRLSEPLFLAFMTLTVLVADREEVSDRTALTAGALAGIAALTRGVGIAAVLGVAAAFWLRRHRRAAGVSAGVGLALVLPWVLWVAAQAGDLDPRLAANYGTYLDEARQAGVGAFLSGLGLGVVAPLARLTLPAVPGWLWYPLAFLLFAAVITGGVTTARRAPALIATLALYLVIVALWPYAPDRFVWIVVPWLALLGTVGARFAWRRGRTARVAVAVLAVAVAVGYMPREYVSLRSRQFAATAEGISVPFGFLAPATVHATPADAVIAVEDEALMYLYTGRRTVPNHLFRWKGRATNPFGPEAMISFFCEAGVTHLAVTGPGAAATPLTEGLDPLFAMTRGPALYRFECSG